VRATLQPVGPEDLAPLFPEELICQEVSLEAGEERVILFNLSGHGHFDLGAFDAYLKGELEDYRCPTACWSSR
jgi:hypothetical protein